jgi:xanthine/CO dehydrogenase XdhC/CoxF family maturation factor
MVHELDLLELAAAWRSEGRRVALATVVATWGSSPRPPGSQLLADDVRRFMARFGRLHRGGSGALRIGGK